MAGEENLIPFSERTEDEQRKIRSAGGKASGASRRAKKNLTECTNILLNMKVADSQKSTKAMMKSLGIDDEDMVYAMAVSVAMLAKASKGDVPSARFLLEASKQYEQAVASQGTDGEVTLADTIEEAYKARQEKEQNAE